MKRDGGNFSYSKNNTFHSFRHYLKGIQSIVLKKKLFHVAENLGLDTEVAKANAMGFIGCLSSVQYNHIAPLKAALRHATIAPVTIQGTLTESSCGSIVNSDVNAVTTVHSSSGTQENT